MEVVSLGPHCRTAGILHKLNYRKCAYPFDWISADIKVINNCIQNNCFDFMDRNNYIISKNQPPYLTLNSKLINYLDPMFIHKNPIDNENDYLYTLRSIERLNNLQKTNKHILFVYTTYDDELNLLSEDINELQNTLNAKYINTLHHLLIINYKDTINTNYVPNTYTYKFNNNIIELIIYIESYDITTVEYAKDKSILNFYNYFNPIEEIIKEILEKI